MKKLSCLIIEDEPIAAEVIADYISQVPFLALQGTCSDAIYALEILRQESIDVIFLDIHLPKLKGLDFLKILENKPQTILTTAYDQYALAAFEEEVVDYLLKPIEFSRFLKAVNKLTPHPSTEAQEKPKSEPGRNFKFFNVNKKMTRVYFDEVLYIESLKDYSKIVTRESSIVTRGQIGEMENHFSKKNFLRIHRSYIVALEQIKSYSAMEIEVETKTLPIGRSYKELVSKRLAEYFEAGKS